jgi:ornithine cyclodeaminase/alanine dehydrogenase-like protein (mu-crystallin family)
MAEAIDAMEALCREEAAGRTLSSDRIHIRLGRGFLRILPGVLTGVGVLGYKEFHSGSQGMRYAVHLFDVETGAPLAVMDGNYVTAIRTGAMAGVALKYLAPADATDVAVIGSGAEARTEMEALIAVRPNIHRGRVFSPRAERREAFSREMRERYGVEIVAVERPEDAIDGAHIVLTATGTRGGQEALHGDWLQPGQHVNSIGSTAPEQREIHASVWRAADRIVLDTHRLLHESGDALVATQAGTIDDAKVCELNQVVAGMSPGRTEAGQLTLYKSVGTGLQDVAAAYRIYQTALERKLGTETAEVTTPRLMSMRTPVASMTSCP